MVGQAQAEVRGTAVGARGLIRKQKATVHPEIGLPCVGAAFACCEGICAQQRQFNQRGRIKKQEG